VAQRRPTAETGRLSGRLDSDRATEAVRVKLLGGFSVSVGDREIGQSDWRLKKAAALVKLLALAPGHRLHREQIMDLLWPNSGRQAASSSLRKTLHSARKVLDAEVGSRYLASEDEQLVLCPDAFLWVDVEPFEDAAAAAHCSRDPAAYRAALDLYAGDLLPGDRYEQWAEEKREELRELYLGLLVELAKAYEERGDLERAVEGLRVAAAREPALEEAHAGLMRLYALLGREGEASLQYERLRVALSKHLGTEPNTATNLLRDEIASGAFPSTAYSPTSPSEEDKELLYPPRHNLPAPRTSFVGRERETLGVKRELVMTRLLTLTGMGGSGKTRLALEVARSLVSAYPDGVWMVELAPLSGGALVPQAVAQALRVKERPGEPLADTLAEVLRMRQTLVVLDNCEHLVEAVAQLADVLLDSCPRLRIIATSREPLGIPGEIQWLVSPLSVPDTRQHPTVVDLERYESVRLFAERARYRNPTFALTPQNARSVAEICKRLAGIPLAIELAAARIGLSVEQIASRLDDSLGLLTSGSRTATARQRTLRGALEWSYDLLGGPERALFARLSVFAGGWTLESAEALASGEGLNESVIFDLLSGLVDKSLVAAGATGKGRVRYRMLEPIRQYAQEKLEESGEAERTKRSHALHFLTMAEVAEPELLGPREGEWWNRLEEDLGNLRAVLSWASEREETEFGLRLAGALRLFWLVRRHYNEGREWLEKALADGGEISTMTRAKALEAVGELALWQGDPNRVKAASEEGLELCEESEISDGHHVAFFTWMKAQASVVENDTERATRLAEESLALGRRANDTECVVYSLRALGLISAERGDHGRAREFFEKGVDLSRDWGSATMQSFFLNDLGWMSLIEDDLVEANALFEEAAALTRELGDAILAELSRHNLAWVALLRGELERAQVLHKENFARLRGVGTTLSFFDGLEGLACVAAAKGEAARAARLFGAAAALHESTGIPAANDERTLQEPYLLEARSHLDEVAWEKAWKAGRAMPLESAIGYALSEERSSAPQAPDRHVSRARPPSLTPREEEVALLVVHGLTNRQIASELVLSQHTARQHVKNILKKLGIHSREQVASRLHDR
jgi:predicted ATPase/DNA-binding SARP family transcriptional activator/DNA-binding CsgD family transcriptional regulator